jgi:ABC-type uncharacterized transport system involved in gliding motility auxiliary subunit
MTQSQSSTINFWGFKSSQALESAIPAQRFIKTAPDFPNTIISGGFKNNYVSVYEIQ